MRLLTSFVDYIDAVSRGLRDAGYFAPPLGWLKTVRQEIRMTAAELGRRSKLSRARISQAEKAEVLGSISLRSMSELAEAMDCRFIYAIVPRSALTIAELLGKQRGRRFEELQNGIAADFASWPSDGLSLLRASLLAPPKTFVAAHLSIAIREPWSAPPRGRPRRKVNHGGNPSQFNLHGWS